jgi:hypothetical protein
LYIPEIGTLGKQLGGQGEFLHHLIDLTFDDFNLFVIVLVGWRIIEVGKANSRNDRKIESTSHRAQFQKPAHGLHARPILLNLSFRKTISKQLEVSLVMTSLKSDQILY